MRFDSIGLFWEDLPPEGGRNKRPRIQPPIPNTGWTPPKYFPNLSKAEVISIDLETYDPELLVHGPGWARGIGHIVGVSIGTLDGSKWYFPMRHEIEKEQNLDSDKVLLWLKDTLSNPHQPKVGANIMYDVGWLRQEGVIVAGDYLDVQYAEALLTEIDPVSLDDLGQRYLGEGKESNLLYQWCADYYGGTPTQKQRANIYRTPPRLTGPYAESDATLPLQIIKKQYHRLAQEGLLDLFYMECALIPLLIDMRFAGVHVDINKAEQVRDRLVFEIKQLKDDLKRRTGVEVNINSADSLAKVFDTAGLSYPRTAKENRPSFTKAFLATVDHPIGNLINEIRKREKIKGTFVESYILNSHVNGFVYGQYHPLRGQGLGTRSGRFSSSTPNLTNLPSRDDELAPLVRGIFVPDEGHEQWRKFDLSQIEYRYLAHFAVGPRADEVRKIYNDDPDVDYHELVRQLIKEMVDILLDRKPTKTVNFGLIYGMTIPKLTRTLGLDKKQGNKLFDAYHKGAPYVKATLEVCMSEVLQTGIITTILGRKSRFDLWEPANYNSEKVPGLPYEKALMTYGSNIKRAYAHKGLNRRLQGSAADHLKMAMLKCYQDGVFAETGVPRLTVHDEIDSSDPGGKDEAFAELKRIMETAIKLHVPVKADEEIGPNWGDTVKVTR